MTHNEFMSEAVALSQQSIEAGGGPFGAIIVKNGEVIARNYNRVTNNFDPTAHAEVNTIRDACAKLKTWDLSGCEIYTSCEPCPMCLSAIYWAGISKIYYANTHKDADAIGFSDAVIYREINLPIDKRTIPTIQIHDKDALEVFKSWNKLDNKEVY